MKRILLLTDFSKSAVNAIDYALHFFHKEHCEFYLMYVHRPNDFTMSELIKDPKADIYSSLLANEKEALERACLELENTNKNPNHSFQYLIDYDDFLSAINQVIALKKIDVLVAGYNGASNVMEVIFGSNTLQIIRNIKKPTLVIPRDFNYKEPNSLLVPLGDDDHLNSDEFNEILNVMASHNPRFHFLRVTKTDDPLRIKEDELKLVQFKGNYSYHYIHGVSLHDAVLTYEQVHTIDLAGVIAKKETVLQRLMEGSSITKISKSLFLPLLIVHH